MTDSSRTGRRKRVTFQLRAEPGSEVFVTGSFNNWDPRSLRLRDNNGDGLFTRAVLLPTGRHEYKFIVDGVWCVDPNCPEWTPNSFGALNSVLMLV